MRALRLVDGDALLGEVRAGRLHAALDVWPGEPRIDPDLLRATTVATPHVAGYSDDGKYEGTRMVYRAFCAAAGLKPQSMAVPTQPLQLQIQPRRQIQLIPLRSMRSRPHPSPASQTRISPSQLYPQLKQLAAGPHPALDTVDPGEAGFTGSLIIAEFDSLEAATAWADSDPYVDAGVFSRVIVKPYKLVLP